MNSSSPHRADAARRDPAVAVARTRPRGMNILKTYSLSHIPDSVLLRDLHALARREQVTTAELIAHIAEVDSRKLYLPAAHSSMRSYCVRELGLSEHAAYKRIEVARLSREYPSILPALGEGRLNVSGVLMLAS